MSSMENLKAIKAMELLQNNSNRSIIIPAEKFVLDTSLNLYKTTVTHNMETVNIDASVYYDNGSCACSVKVIDKNSFTLYTTEKKECRVVIFANWNAKPVYQYNSLASFTTDDLLSTTNKRYVNDNQLEIINNMSDKNLDKLGDLSTLDKTVVETIEELFQSGSNGKKILASAITAKGIATSETDSFETMASNIAKIINTDEGSELLLDVDGRYIDEVATFNNKRTSDLILSTSEKITTQTPDGKSYVMKFLIENQEDKDDFRYKSKEHEIKTLLPFEPGDKIMKDVDDGVYKLFKRPVKYNSWITFLENEPGNIHLRGDVTSNKYKPITPSVFLNNDKRVCIPARNPNDYSQVKMYTLYNNSWKIGNYRTEYTFNTNASVCAVNTTNIYSLGGINSETEELSSACYQSSPYVTITSTGEIVRKKLANIPDNMTKVYDATACNYNTDIYLIGGRTNPLNINEYTKQVLIYNITDDTWKKGVNLPEVLINAKSFIYKDEMYVIGESSINKTNILLYKFDFVFKKWSLVNNEIINNQQLLSISLDNDNLILFYNYDRQVGVKIYNIKKNKWSFGSFLVDDKIISTSSIYSCDTHIYNNKVYLMNILTEDIERRIFCYDIDSDTWENNTVAIPKTITNVTPYYDKISDTLFVLGGIDNKEDGTTQSLETVYKHNYRTGESSIIGALPKKLYDYSITRFGDNLYLFGGYTEKTSDNPIGINKDVIVYSLNKGAVEKVCTNVIPGYAFNIKAVNRGSANKCFLFNVGTSTTDTTAKPYTFNYNSETISMNSQMDVKVSEIMSVFYYNNFLYVYNGDTSVSKCDLMTNTWTEIPFSETIISKNIKMVEKFNDSLYFIGGLSKTTGKPVSSICSLDLVTETWSLITSAPETMYTGVTCFVDNYLTIYGYTSDYPDGKPKNKVQEYIFKPIDKWDYAFGTPVIYHDIYNAFLYNHKLHLLDDNHYIFNILTGEWRSLVIENKTPESTYLYYKDFIYKLGNHKCEKFVARFNLKTELWENSFGQLPVYYNSCASCVDKNTGNCYLLSGTSSIGKIDYKVTTIEDINDVKSKLSMNITKYSIEQNKSITGVIITNGEPVELAYSKSVFYDNKIYLFGGVNKLGEVNDKIYVINPDTFECILLDTIMPTPRWGFNIEVIDNKAYIFNGKSTLESSNVCETIDVFDLDLNIFGISSKNPFPRLFAGSVTTSNKILVTNGKKGLTSFTDVLLYEPSGYIGTLTETFDDDINFPTFKHRTIITSSNSDALHIKCKIPIEVI